MFYTKHSPLDHIFRSTKMGTNPEEDKDKEETPAASLTAVDDTVGIDV